MEELMAKYLANELDEKERTDFESQLIRNEDFSLEFEAYMNAWALNEPQQAQSFDTAAAWLTVSEQVAETTSPVMEVMDNEITDLNGKAEKNNEAEVIHINEDKGRRNGFSFLKIAATLLILAVGGYFVINNLSDEVDQNNLMEHISANTGMNEFELPDGTSVKLNASSKLVYDKNFGIDNRNVTLLGQADFDVTRNENLPFIIEAGQSRVEVLGTSFDVAAYPNKEVKLVVTEGTVSFSSLKKEGVKEILTQGQQAIIDIAGESIEVSEVANDNFKSWWTREFKFEDAPVHKIFERLERTYWVEIDYPESMKDCLWTHYNDKDHTIENVLELFKGSYTSVSYEIKENKIKLEGTACDK
ncbi:MAG: DUF4974 domain-containing protein [Roseivirga sp.]